MDLVCHQPAASLAHAPAFVAHFGGATANVAVRCARLGADVTLAGGAGDDAWGAWLLDRLAQEGVGLEHFVLVEGAPTPVAFVTVDEAAIPSFTIHGDGISAGIAAVADRLEGAVETHDALFFASNTLVGERERKATLAARDRAFELGRPVVFDPNLRIGRWSSAARAVSESLPCVRGAFLVKCNADEAMLLSGEREVEAAAAALLAAGARHVVVTLGAGGAILRGGRLDRDVPAPAVDPVDTTGAGDALMGVLLARLTLSGFYAPAIAAALPEAVAVAAGATQTWGAIE